MFRQGCLVLIVLAALPTVHGAPPPPMGTASQPEVTDGTGDVLYDPAYTGPRSDYLDIDAVWIEYLAESDRFQVTLRVLDGRGWPNAPPNAQLNCDATATSMHEGEASGELSFHGLRGPQSTEFQGWVSRSQTEAPSTSAPEATFQLIDTAPGAMVWTVPRDWALWVGDEVSEWSASCLEFDRTLPMTPIYKPLYINSDRAEASAMYSLADAKPLAISEPGESPITSAPAAPSSDAERTVAHGFIGFLVAGALAAAWTRRHGK